MPSAAVLAPPEPRFRSAPQAHHAELDTALTLAEIAGINLDPWQVEGLRDALGLEPGGSWAAPQVAWIVPRQNGKNFGVMVAQLLWLFASPDDRDLTHSAHNFRTVKGHFRDLREVIDGTPEFSRRIARNGFRVSNEDLSVTTTDGSKLSFMTRTKGSGRGLHGDKVVLDEAMWLWDDSLEAVLPIQSARRNPQTWFTSSSPTPGDQSDVLRRLCRRGRKGDPELAYLEFSATEDASLDDEDVWHQANPALGRHLSLRAVRLERKTMTDDGFARERLGIWHEEDDQPGAIADADWNAHRLVSAEPDWQTDPISFGVEGNVDNDWISVVSAGRTSSNRIGIELVRHTPGTDWFLEWAVEANERHAPQWWVLDPKSSTADLFADKMRAAGLPVLECGMTNRDLPAACSGLLDDIRNHRIEHLGQDLLDAAVAGADTRPIGESWLWDRRRPGVVLTPLVAATLARWGVHKEPTPPPAPFAFYS